MKTMANMRRKARTTVLQALYESDCVGHDLINTVQRFGEDHSLTKDAASFAQGMAQGVVENREEIDALIQRFAPNFPVAQLALVDRTILRLAIFELTSAGTVPAKVVINEAVELAKSFGSASSSRFINGVLGSVNSVMLQK